MFSNCEIDSSKNLDVMVVRPHFYPNFRKFWPPTESKIIGFVSKSNQHWLLTPLLCLTSVKLIGSKTLTLCWWDCIFNQIFASCAPPRSENFLDLSQNLISSGSWPYYYAWQVWNWFVQKPWRYGGETAFLLKFLQVLAPHGVKNYRICLKI